MSAHRTVCDISKIRNVVNSQPVRYGTIKSTNCLRYIKDTKCSQFTTRSLYQFSRRSLFAIYQRYEMQSIHNPPAGSGASRPTVCDISKIRNVVNSQRIGGRTLSLQTVCDISKIRNVVNSQLGRYSFSPCLYCLRYIKDTKCSQFTTRSSPWLQSSKLFAIYQRYEMQSIHNTMMKVKSGLMTVCDISKIRNVVNSQRQAHSPGGHVHCLRYIKDTKCSQFTTIMSNFNLQSILFAIYQRYEMQSIHNLAVDRQERPTTVCDISKIRNVVNSQRIDIEGLGELYCLRYIKDTKCSQFTTSIVFVFFVILLFAIYQRYEMQSIHNFHHTPNSSLKTVCDISKIRNVVNSQPLCLKNKI